MAWETFERDGISGATGSLPLDELARALSVVARAYEERFGRKPTTVELLYNVERLLQGGPHRFVSDPATLLGARVRIERPVDAASHFVDANHYEGVYAERPTAEYQVVTRDPAGRPTDDVVISIPELEANNRTWDQVKDDVFTDPPGAYGVLGLTLRRS